MEYVGTTFRWAANKLGWVNFDKIVGQHEFTVNLANTWLQFKDGLVSGYTQINDSIVQAYILLHNSLLFLIRLFILCLFFFDTLSFARLSSLVLNSSRSISNNKWKSGDGFVDTPKLLNLKLDLLRGTWNWAIWLHNICNNLNNWLVRDLWSVCQHTLANFSLDLEQNSLNWCPAFTKHDKTIFTSGSGSWDTSSNADLLASEFLSEFLNFMVLNPEASFGITLRSNDIHITEFACGRIIRVLDEFSLLFSGTCISCIHTCLLLSFFLCLGNLLGLLIG